ncbi:MAG: lactonase family protein [Acidobacteriia bacterium]|nr:lactonase family protein [Terriglobia bacterium]
MSKKTRGVVAFVALCGLSLFLLNCGSNVNRSSGLLYVLSQGSSAVSSYSINLTSGGLSLINSNASTCPTAPCGLPESILLDPERSVAFVLDQGAPDPDLTHVPPQALPPAIYGYTVNSDGSLSAPGSPVTLSQPADSDTAVAMVRDPAGKFLFVVNQGTIPSPAGCPRDPDPNKIPPGNDACPSLSVFTMQSGSTSLSLVGGKPIRLGRIPTSIAAINTAAQTLLYITSNKDLSGNNNDNTVSQYSVDTSGNVTELPGSPYATASNPSAVVAVTTSPIGGAGGLFLYVTNVTTNSVSVYQVCTVQSVTCTQQDATNLTLLPVGTPANAGSNPVAMVADPTSKFLYVVSENSSQVFGFGINATQGTLNALNPANLNTGSHPIAIAMHSSGKFLFVSNNGSNNVSAFAVDTTSGSMSSPTTVTNPGQPAGLVSK